MPVVKEWAYTRVPSKDPALVPLYRPPPKVDKKFNTAAYPVNTDNIMLRSAGHKPSVWVMRDISLNRQRQEKQDYYNAKEPAYKDFRWMHGNCPGYCSICSEIKGTNGCMNLVHHNHQSSHLDRITADTDIFGQYYCVGCKCLHPVKTGTRYPVIMSSSTLNGWRGMSSSYTGDPFHIDWDTCSGAKIRTMLHSFRAQFQHSLRPLDILAVIGINDLLNGTSIWSIIDQLRRFRDIVAKVAPGEKSGDSTFAVSTVINPPKLTRFTRRDHRHVPTMDRTKEIAALNTKIIELNLESPQSPFQVARAPSTFQTFGVKFRKERCKDRPRNLMQLAVGHKHIQWRESDPNKQLHLCDSKRITMGKSCIRYFSQIYGIPL